MEFEWIFSGDRRGGSELTNGTEGTGGGGGPTYLSDRGSLARGSLGGGGQTARSSSKQSLLDIVGNRLGVSGGLSLGVILFNKHSQVAF